jgi:hypothetical protein
MLRLVNVAKRCGVHLLNLLVGQIDQKQPCAPQA